MEGTCSTSTFLATCSTSSWSRHWSFRNWTTATPSLLVSLPPPSGFCSLSVIQLLYLNYNLPRPTHVTPIFISLPLHPLQNLIAPACWAAKGTPLLYLHTNPTHQPDLSVLRSLGTWSLSDCMLTLPSYVFCVFWPSGGGMSFTVVRTAWLPLTSLKMLFLSFFNFGFYRNSCVEIG